MFAIVIGAGIAGRSACRYLTARGDSVLLYDDNQHAHPCPQVELITDIDQALAELKQADALILSPSVPLTHALVGHARVERVKIMSEVDLALSAYQGSVIAVTGTNGKSTVCKYIQHLLHKNNCDSAMAGNIGMPVTSVLLDHHPAYLVLELSSYQLAQSHPPAAKVAIFTNFSVDHLQYHRDLASYFKAKSKVFANAQLAISDAEVYRRLPQEGHLVVTDNETDVETSSTQKKNNAKTGNIGKLGAKVWRRQSYSAEFSSFAAHDVSNAMMAVLAVSHLLGVSTQTLAAELADCKKPAHRLQHIGTANGYPLINDSKATNIAATLAALQAQPQPVLLIIGGISKSQDFSLLLAQRDKISKLYIFGADGRRIYSELAEHLPCTLFPNLASVIQRLKTELPSLTSGVLFSPACATDSEFKDFAARGDAFVSLSLTTWGDL